MLDLCDKVIQHLTSINAVTKKLKSRFSKMKSSFEPYLNSYKDEPEIQLIKKSLTNIITNPEPFDTPEELALFQDDCWSIFNAIQIFSQSMVNFKEEESRIIEKKLFNIVFQPGDDYKTKILPVYRVHDEFLFTESPISNFKSSTGSGKTRCAPFFFSIKALQEKMKRPFFIMTQPSFSIIRDKITDFTEILGDSVIYVTNFNELESMYDNFPDKPVVALFTPHTLVKILARARDKKFPLVKYSRFVLDEIHERSVDTDVLVALLAEKMKTVSFPLQLLMMSATPDPRILESFEKVQMIELADTELFHITDIPKEVKDFKELDTTVRDSAIDIIKQMSKGEFKPGHLLIFTSGNRRINNIMNLISNSIETTIGKENKNIRLLKKFDNFLTSQELFYDHLEEVLLNDDDSENALYFLIIKYAGFVNREAQQIGKNPIKGHPNVIKIIVATNSIESSITIDGLAAVIDSGICNTPHYDRIKGLTNLEEGPISTQSQTQRRGRVGRKRDGICVQITIKNHPPIELRPPAIETEDISSNILCLRKIKINLEEINNLPLPGVSAENMKSYMDELIKIGALDSDKKLTKIGSRLAAFSSLSPFVSSSILKVADKYNNESVIASIVGALTFLVLSTNNIFTEAITDIFRKNFCEDSDIITLMSSLIEIMLTTSKNLRKKLIECGFHQANCIKLIGTIEQIASIIYDDDKQSLWTDINGFYTSHDMMKFIQQIMTEIEKIRSDWVNCRRSEYISVINILNNPSFIYKGDKSLTNDGTEPNIKINMRPGGKGFASPGACFIMQFSCSENTQYYGSIIHRDLSRKEICHPNIIETSIIMNNAFTSPLIEGYIGENRNNFKPFQRTNSNPGNYHGGIICYNDQFGDKTIISYVTQKVDDNVSKQLINDAIEKVQKIIPFVPRTILVKNDILKAIVAVTSFGDNNITTRIINYTDSKPYSYHVDKTTIDYLIDHFNELNNVDGHLVVAMTGEKFSYLADENDDFIGNPTTSSNVPCVFSLRSDYYSHLVVLSNEAIPNASQLNWVDRKISVNYSDVDALIHVANQVFRGVVEISHEFDMVYCLDRNSSVCVNGNIPQCEETTQDSNVFRPIGCMLDKFAMHCINGTRLVNKVDFSDFSMSGNVNCDDLKKDIITIAGIKKKHLKIDPLTLHDEIIRNAPSDLNSLPTLISQRSAEYTKLDMAKAEMKDLNDRYNKYPSERNSIRNQQKENKAKRDSIQSNISYYNSLINPIHEFLNSFSKGHGIDAKMVKSLASINSPFHLLSYKINVQPSYLDANVRVDESNNIIYEFQHYRPDLEIEVVPLSSIVINHKTNSNLSEKEFIKRINQVCNKFGGIVKYKSDYQKNDKSHYNKGCIRITLYTGKFAIPFAGEIQAAIGSGDNVILKIPSKIVPNCLLSRPDVIESIDEWITTNGLHLHKNGFKYAGNSQEIEKALNLLSNKETQLKIPYKSYSIPGGIEISKVIAAVNRKNSKLSIKSKWGINKSARLIYVPEEIDEETVQEFINSVNLKDKKKINEEEEIIYDYLFCCDDTAVLSGYQMPLYKQDGSARLLNYCVTCAYDLFKNEVERLYDQEEDKPRMNLLCENTDPVRFIELLPDSNNEAWPEIPLGQMLWCLVSEPVMNAVTRTWFSAIIYQAFHCSQFFDFCPEHPSILMRITGGRMHCSQRGCQMYLCENCHKWHKPGQCKNSIELPPGFRICPACKRPVEKTEACNHLACKCGAHFCYYCGWGPQNDSSPVYQHLSEKHGGCFNDPPDYKKYYLHQNVSEKELADFYAQYPQFKPPSS